MVLNIFGRAPRPAWLPLLALSALGLACGSPQHPTEQPSEGIGGNSSGGTGGTAGTPAGGTGGNSGSSTTQHPDCPEFNEGTESGTVASSAIVEASGIVASRRNEGVLWVHNDSGDSPPRVFAMSTSGADLGTYNIVGVSAFDWEDLAADDQYLYLADIGDNAEIRPNVTVYRVPEPVVSAEQATVVVEVQGAETLQLEYPDGPHNAETLLVDPVSADLFIVAKAPDGISGVYRDPAPHSPDKLTVLERVATLPFSSDTLPGIALTTGGDISPAGDAVLIRTYNSAFLWRRPEGASLAAAFDTVPCPVPLRIEPQGEAIGFDADGSGYFTVSEREHQPIWYFSRL